MAVETMSSTLSAETKMRNLETFDAELRKIDPELAEMVISGGSASSEAESALSELDQQFSAAGLDNGLATSNFTMLGENEVEAAAIIDFIKRKAEKLIKELRFLAR